MSSFASDFKSRDGPPQASTGSENPPKYTLGGLHKNDPRTSSTESLTPSLPEYEEIERRILLVIYIHGFMGNDTSFQSFPAHVHQYLKLALSDSHVVHSKVYPRYKTYKTIEIARDNFSKWLEPLETPKTDVVLVGHSMGGLLAADIILMPSTQQQPHSYFKHRILGGVNLDAPLLGMHPGIIVSGISSLFRKNEAPKPAGESSALSPGTTGLPSPSISMYSMPSTASEMLPSPPPPPAPFTRPEVTNDPYFNPTFANDVRIQERSWWKNVVHFVQKHSSEGLIDAASKHIMSHLEFGGTMFDLNRLQTRYESVRRLEDVDDLKQIGLNHVPPQVRFIQYYTICNGYPKKPKDQDMEKDAKPVSIHGDLGNSLSASRISVETSNIEPPTELSKQDIETLSLSNSERSSLEFLSPEPMLDDEAPTIQDNSVDIKVSTNNDKQETIPANSEEKALSAGGESQAEEKALVAEVTDAVAALDLDLPPVPELPPQPEPFNSEKYVDKDARKLAEKESKRINKVYAQAVKDREKVIKEREKIIEKRRKRLAQEAEKRAKDEKKRMKKDGASAATSSLLTPVESATPSMSIPEEKKHDDPSSPNEWTLASPVDDGATAKKDKGKAKVKEEKEEKKKERKFCNVAKSNGQVDPRWISVFMKDMDEVAAHTGLFFAGEHYEGLVGDVGHTIVEWVHADMTKKTVLELQ